MGAMGTFVWGIGALAVFGIDILSSVWLLNEHGLIWVIVSWVTFLPLFVIPFLAGLGVIYAVALGVTVLGYTIREQCA